MSSTRVRLACFLAQAQSHVHSQHCQLTGRRQARGGQAQPLLSHAQALQAACEQLQLHAYQAQLPQLAACCTEHLCCAGEFAEQIREQWLQERMEYFSELEQAIFDEALGEDECTRPHVQAALTKLNPELPEAKVSALAASATLDDGAQDSMMCLCSDVSTSWAPHVQATPRAGRPDQAYPVAPRGHSQRSLPMLARAPSCCGQDDCTALVHSAGCLQQAPCPAPRRQGRH